MVAAKKRASVPWEEHTHPPPCRLTVPPPPVRCPPGRYPRHRLVSPRSGVSQSRRRGHPDSLCSGNPADTDHLGAAVHADDCTQRADPNGLSGKAGSDEVEELVDVGSATMHHRHVLD